MPLYDGRKALVTGAASGIGKHLAYHLVEQGARVLCSDINETAGNAAVAELNRGRPAEVAYFVKADVTNWLEMVELFRRAVSIFEGNLDFVFANAGTAALGFPDQAGPPNFTPIMVNLVGVMYTIQVAVNHFREFKTPGRIVVTASQSSLHPFSGEPVYTASKFGVLGLVRATAPRTVREKILINAVGPGSTTTALMPPDIEALMNASGLKVSKETIMKAFDLFLTPECKYSGQFAEAVGDNVSLYKFPIPSFIKNKL
ncbi:NAD(P)-binding protein [Roridomyces roridus]|uniref:NAD(P)-binding protein n=1 Tax=Roridomyces roridus TaxID=1738132 RepID=A0AAD7C125_9AGAR|nr:NAD(P)-binding protein [Roridomyces roridus]